MTPDKALELVGKYARLNHAIKACKGRIGDALDKCPGLNGKRLERVTESGYYAGDGIIYLSVGDLTEAAWEDQDTHLPVWYGKDYGETVYHYQDDVEFKRWPVRAEVEGEACAACFAAHLIVQERKALRRQLASVKAAMTRSIPCVPSPGA